MRLCRFCYQDRRQFGFYYDDFVVPLVEAAARWQEGSLAPPSEAVTLLDYLPPDGPYHPQTKSLWQWLQEEPQQQQALAIPVDEIQLLVPIGRPNKLLLLAGNYAAHIEEHGDVAAERAETFPYVFMKPPSTTLTDPGRSVTLPACSPAAIDWELELAVVIGRRIKGVKESDALQAVAGYTIINDISDRKFQPNPQRKPRDRDRFFDWLHGKWHDGFCPCGPCITAATAIPDPQQLAMRLTVNGQVKQEASTRQQIFPVAAVIEFLSRLVTLEPGDLISTGTPAGVGNARGEYLRSGDVMLGEIERIGRLRTSVA